MQVKLIYSQPDAEKLITYLARVSNPIQTDENAPRLIKYLIKHKHWSPFEMIDLCVEIQCSRAIAAQIIRHRSFSFQEFSQRYSEVTGYDIYKPRRQDTKNKQNSIDDLPEETIDWFMNAQQLLFNQAFSLYQTALDKNVAKEVARMVLPLSTNTKLYMKGSLRSWVHYLEVRTAPETQKEHRDVALAIKAIFIKQYPIISEALGWTNAKET